MFTDDFKIIDPRYVNFTASCLVGESKNKDLVAGIKQMQQYVQGLKCVQPWVYYVLGMIITKDKAVFLHGEGSGTECLKLMLRDGRGHIEFIWILLGLALVNKVDPGHNSDMVVKGKQQACTAKNIAHHSAASNMATSKAMSQQIKQGQVYSVPDPLS